MRLSLDEYALRLAETAAQRSEDPKRQVGAAVLDNRGHVLALGYNGPPPRVNLPDDYWRDHTIKAAMVIHAEVNALRFVLPGQAALLATTYMPCTDCVKHAAAQGVRKIVFRDRPDLPTLDETRMAGAAERFGLELSQLDREDE